jgi:hypothetical protein
MDVILFDSDSVATPKKSGRLGANHAADLTEFHRTAAARAVKFVDSKAIDEWRGMLQKRLVA